VTTKPMDGVRVIGTPLPYADGAETTLLDLITNADDVSSGSDELARHVRDWPTRYHLSRARTHVLRPLRIEPGMRVLDVGAGTGTHARFLGEQGADVVALEGSLQRANVTAARCRDLPNVEVVCGPLDAFTDEERFDLVVAIGVLEYAGDVIGGSEGADALLERLRGLTRANGAVVVTVENQIGLKYLVGCAEDHLGLPWIGVEGYPLATGVRTYPRSVLRQLLEEAGLGVQHWMYAFPDYKLPKVLFTDATYEEPSATRLIDQLAPHPVRDFAHPRYFLADDRGVHRTFVEAGLGPEVANSFLVVAASDDMALVRHVDREVSAWHFGDERMRQWMRVKTIRRRDGDLTVDSVMAWPGEVPRQREWLRQNGEGTQPYLSGPTVEQRVRAALGSGDEDEVARLLTLWREHLLSISTPWDGEAEPEHPFVLPTTNAVLPPDHLDVELRNFVIGDADTLHYVDSEWWLSGGVDIDLACVRALWFLAHDLVTSGERYPWSSSTTVDELTSTLGSRCGLAVSAALLGAWRRAESELQSHVHGPDPRDNATRVEAGQLSRDHLALTRSYPFSRLAAEIGRLQEELRALADAHREAHVAVVELRDSMAQAGETITALRAELDTKARELDANGQELDTKARELDAKGQELDTKARELGHALLEIRELRGSTSWRITAPARAVSRRLRSVLRRR
jgi:precorrin-6B methylase 2